MPVQGGPDVDASSNGGNGGVGEGAGDGAGEGTNGDEAEAEDDALPPGPEPDVSSEADRALLLEAIKGGDAESVTALLQSSVHGNDVLDARGGFRGLHAAAQAGHAPIIALLLDPKLGRASVDAPRPRHLNRARDPVACSL